MIFNIVKANGQIKELNTANAELVKQLEAVRLELGEAQDVIGSFMTEKEGMDKRISDMKAEYEAKLSTLQNEIAKANESASEKAKLIVSSIGVEPETVKVSINPTEVEVFGKWKSLSGNEQMSYYNAHRETILKQLGLNK